MRSKYKYTKKECKHQWLPLGVCSHKEPGKFCYGVFFASSIYCDKCGEIITKTTYKL